MTQLSARDPQTVSSYSLSGSGATLISQAEIVQHDAAFADLTDLANTRSFRYMY